MPDHPSSSASPLDALTPLEAFSPQGQTAIRAATQFAATTVAPAAAGWELNRELPREVLEVAAAAGLTHLLVPEALDGHGLSNTEFARTWEEVASADLPVAFCLIVHNNVSSAIARQGSAAQQAEFLPGLKTMARRAAFLLTEPRGGSDAAAIATRATACDGGFVLDGTKAWVTNARHADLLCVYAQTDPAAGWRGIASFLVDADSPGISTPAPYAMLGGHALGAGEVHFDGVRVAADRMLAPPGEGFKAAMAGIDLARANVAAMCCGMLRAALGLAVGFASERQMFGARLADQQGVQWQLADVATDLHAARTMTDFATRALDAQADATVAAAHAKKFATRVALTGLAQCMQSLGASGLRHETVLPRHLAAAKIAQYLDGATEIQNVVISRALLGQ